MRSASGTGLTLAYCQGIYAAVKRPSKKAAGHLVLWSFKLPPAELAELQAEAEASKAASATDFVRKAIRNEIKRSRRRRESGGLEP